MGECAKEHDRERITSNKDALYSPYKVTAPTQCAGISTAQELDGRGRVGRGGVVPRTICKYCILYALFVQSSNGVLMFRVETIPRSREQRTRGGPSNVGRGYMVTLEFSLVQVGGQDKSSGKLRRVHWNKCARSFGRDSIITLIIEAASSLKLSPVVHTKSQIRFSQHRKWLQVSWRFINSRR